ncbi:unnamed protein product [Acanthoscelides obtectus]|uniref:C2H2-type domain-containing protein n=1 Tax=Acanthoscelides obtectus TaxID=200917 RepID=A0A9P0PJR2_ACAOB|nr:unnamed protein product [Acanthoscelides obtectus]CAK1676169.1 Zinc finger Y-chromosomal protein [Acanthoscelides obtectus]
METEHSTDINPVEEPDSKRSMSSTETYSTLHSVKHEHGDSGNQVKMENPLEVVVKSEMLDAEPSVDNIKLENMDSLMLNEEIDIKYEYEDSTWDRIKVEEKFEPGFEADSAADTVDQMKMEFQESENLEEKPDLSSTNFENLNASALHDEFDIKTESDEGDGQDSAFDRIKIEEKFEPGFEADWAADTVDRMKMEFQESEKLEGKFENMVPLGLHDEFDVKTESDQGDGHNLASYSAQIKKKLENEIGNPPIEGKNSFNCYICNDTSHCKSGLIVHVSKNHPKFPSSVFSKILQCANCGYKTAHKGHLARHMIKHTRAKHTCTMCDASFTRKILLDIHTLQTHPQLTATASSKLHKCTHCEYKTTYASALVEHIMKHKADSTCMICDALFSNKVSLDNHILQKHPERTASVSSKIHECTHCEYQTTYVGSLANHIMKHTANFTCMLCDALFSNKTSLDNHILQKHPELSASVSSKVHECTHCAYKTTHANYLVKHITKHTNDLTCTMCDELFTKKTSLGSHILQKHPESTASISSKIHKCTHCEYKTTYKGHLVKHMKKHTGAKFTCTK